MNSDAQSETKLQQAGSTRLQYLDGVRGWAAFVVLVQHITIYFLIFSSPILRYDNDRVMGDLHRGDYFDIVIGVLLKIATNGHLAVLIFFVLSGYVLSASHLSASQSKLPLATASRYFRLMIPITFTSFVAYALLKFGMMKNLEIAQGSGKISEWFSTSYKFDASILDVLKFSLYDVFFNYEHTRSYDPPLWTMSIELLGSFLIYAYIGIFRRSAQVNRKLVISLAVVLYIVNPFIASFMIGYAIAEINLIMADKDFFENRKVNSISVFMFFLSLILATMAKLDGDYGACLFATVIVFSVSASKTLRMFFQNKVSRFLGKISFPLYLIQVPVICSWSSFLLLKLAEQGLSADQASLIIFTSTILMVVALSVFMLPLEKFSVTYSKKIGNLFLRQDRTPS